MAKTWLIGNVGVTIFKVFHPPSDIASAHAGISVNVMKSPTDVYISLVLHKNFCHCTLTSILSLWTAGTKVVRMCRTCVHTGGDRRRYWSYKCNSTMLITSGTDLVAYSTVSSSGPDLKDRRFIWRWIGNKWSEGPLSRELPIIAISSTEGHKWRGNLLWYVRDQNCGHSECLFRHASQDIP
jgi:hypothetical protein